MLDIHTHILPGIDDGSRSVEQSVSMLQCEAEQGVTTVALTPHYDAKRETPAQFVQRREVAKEHLLNEIGDRKRIQYSVHRLAFLYCIWPTRTSGYGLFQLHQQAVQG